MGYPVAGRELSQACRIARVARAHYPKAHAGPHHVRAPSQERLQDNVREVGLLGDDLLQPLARNGQHLPVLTHHGREVHCLPGEHVQLAQETARKEDPYRPCLAGEVVDHLHLTLEDDYEVVLGVARPEQDIPYLRLPRPAVASEDLDLVFPQRRGPRTADLVHSIIHGATSSLAFAKASIVPPTAGWCIPTIGCLAVAWASLSAYKHERTF